MKIEVGKSYRGIFVKLYPSWLTVRKIEKSGGDINIHFTFDDKKPWFPRLPTRKYQAQRSADYFAGYLMQAERFDRAPEIESLKEIEL